MLACKLRGDSECVGVFSRVVPPSLDGTAKHGVPVYALLPELHDLSNMLSRGAVTSRVRVQNCTLRGIPRVPENTLTPNQYTPQSPNLEPLRRWCDWVLCSPRISQNTPNNKFLMNGVRVPCYLKGLECP